MSNWTTVMSWYPALDVPPLLPQTVLCDLHRRGAVVLPMPLPCLRLRPRRTACSSCLPRLPSLWMGVGDWGLHGAAGEKQAQAHTKY